MIPYSVSRQARSDLDDIWAWIARDDLAAADRSIMKLLDTCIHLARNPLAGELCEELRPNLRRFCVGNYVIYYRAARRVTVARFLHGARDAGRAFADG